MIMWHVAAGLCCIQLFVNSSVLDEAIKHLENAKDCWLHKEGKRTIIIIIKEQDSLGIRKHTSCSKVSPFIYEYEFYIRLLLLLHQEDDLYSWSKWGTKTLLNEHLRHFKTELTNYHHEMEDVAGPNIVELL